MTQKHRLDRISRNIRKITADPFTSCDKMKKLGYYGGQLRMLIYSNRSPYEIAEAADMLLKTIKEKYTFI